MTDNAAIDHLIVSNLEPLNTDTTLNPKPFDYLYTPNPDPFDGYPDPNPNSIDTTLTLLMVFLASALFDK